MAYLDKAGLTRFWNVIKSKLSNKADLVDGKVPASQLPDNSIGGDCNSVMISGTVDLSTMTVVSMSHSYAEIKAILAEKKMVFVETNYGFGYAYGQITSDYLRSNALYFQVMLQNDFGDGWKLYYLAVRVTSSDEITLTPYIVNTTSMFG